MLTSIDSLNPQKRDIVKTYNMVAEGYDQPALRYAALIAAELVRLAQVKPGDAVLDAGTGTGSAALEAAKRAGAGGRVFGVDLAGAMLERAQEKIEASGLDNIAVRNDDVEHLDFDDETFNVVVCASSIHFLPDMPKGLSELARVTKRGGCLAFSTYGETAFQPMSDMMQARLRTFGVNLETPRPFPWQRLTDPERCRQLLKSVKMESILVQVQQLGYYLGGGGEWWDVLWHSGFRGTLASLNPEQLQEFRAAHCAEVEELRQPRGLWLNVPAIFATGEKIW